MEKELLCPTLEMKIKGEFTLQFPIHLTFPFFLYLLQIKKQPLTSSFTVVFKYEKVTFVWFTNTDYVPALRLRSLNRGLVEKKESWVPKQLTTASVGTSQHSRTFSVGSSEPVCQTLEDEISALSWYANNWIFSFLEK